jgi:hypothetical protein
MDRSKQKIQGNVKGSEEKVGKPEAIRRNNYDVIV